MMRVWRLSVAYIRP